jgi:hypothetical protein
MDIAGLNPFAHEAVLLGISLFAAAFMINGVLGICTTMATLGQPRGRRSLVTLWIESLCPGIAVAAAGLLHQGWWMITTQ